jgi:hypothetical protein
MRRRALKTDVKRKRKTAVEIMTEKEKKRDVISDKLLD